MIYRAVFIPIVGYAASEWTDICTEEHLRKLGAIQRQGLLAVTGAYRTASLFVCCRGRDPSSILLNL